jgi:hypothetical protein
MSTTPTSTEQQITSTQAVEQAAQAQESQQQTQTNETQTTQTTEQTSQSQTTATQQSETQNSATQLTDEQRAEQERAINVYKLLNDPKTAPGVVRMLAEQLGIVQTIQQSTTEVPKEPTIADVIGNALGEEYQFLAPKIAAGIEKAIELRLTPVQQQLVQNQARNEFERAYNELNSATGGDFVKHEQKIVALMDVLKPGKDVPVKDYLNHLYSIAKGAPTPAPPSQQVRQIVNRMEKNAQANLPSPSAATEQRVIKGPNLPTLEESILAAVRGEVFE